MSFIDLIKEFFVGKKVVVGGRGMIGQKKKEDAKEEKGPHKVRQVYEGRETPPPDWAQGKSSTDLVGEIPNHVKCRYAPSFERKKIMSTAVGADGNLIPEYDGVAGSCGAVKQFGLKVGKQNGQNMPFRYVDLNHCYRACCDNPQKCPFYLNAVGEMESMNARRK